MSNYIEASSNAKMSLNKVSTKKAGWFTRWFDRKCKEAWMRYHEDSRDTIRTSVVEDNTINADGMNIRIFNATGGTIVEFRRYDRISDRHNNKMYVIPTEQNFSEQFSKIVSMEMIR